MSTGADGVIQVHFGNLQSSAETLQKHAGQLEQQVVDLLNSLKPLKASWYESGSSAGQAAEASETRLVNAVNDLIGVIGQFSGKVQEAHDMQQQLEAANTSMFS